MTGLNVCTKRHSVYSIHFLNVSKHLRRFKELSSNRVSSVVWKFKASPKIQPVPSVVWFVWFWILFDLLINSCV